MGWGFDLKIGLVNGEIRPRRLGSCRCACRELYNGGYDKVTDTGRVYDRVTELIRACEEMGGRIAELDGELGEWRRVYRG